MIQNPTTIHVQQRTDPRLAHDLQVAMRLRPQRIKLEPRPSPRFSTSATATEEHDLSNPSTMPATDGAGASQSMDG